MTKTTTCDAGYLAQRSSNPKAVLDFLRALPEGTLESGIETMPEEIRKRFKLRSPKITKALIKLGVDADVISGYYSAFSHTRQSKQGSVNLYHISTFPNSSIVHLQGDSNHFISCMRSGVIDEDEGSQYREDIHADVEAYNSGDLALWVVGKPASKLVMPDGSIHESDSQGFISRAKVRVLYYVDDNNDYPYALFVDRIYGNHELLLDSFSELQKWNAARYNLPIIVKDWVPLKQRKISDVEYNKIKDGRLKYRFDGYHDSLHYQGGAGYYLFPVSLTQEGGYAFVDDIEMTASSKGVQYRTYTRAKRDPHLKDVPVNALFIDRGTNKLVSKASKRDECWRYEGLSARALRKTLVQTQVLNPMFQNIAKKKGFVLLEDTVFSRHPAVLYESQALKVRLRVPEVSYYTGCEAIQFYVDVFQGYKSAHHHSYMSTISFTSFWENGSYILREDFESYIKFNILSNVETYDGWVSVRDGEAANAAYNVQKFITEFLSQIPQLDTLMTKCYNKKRVKQLLRR